jgi:hypothetical protein
LLCSEWTFDQRPSAAPFRRLSRRLERGGRRHLSNTVVVRSENRKAEAASRVRLIALADQREADCLAVAFFRFVELHGRVVRDPDGLCSLTTVIGAGPHAGQTRLVTFWNARAARLFDEFWPAYRRVHGRRAGYALSPAG